MIWLKIIAATALFSLASLAGAADVKVSITGPDKADGGFALVGGSDAKDAVLRWRVDSPSGAVPPLELLDSQGRPVLVFMSPVRGVYNVVLTGQVPADGLDPFGESVHRVVIGGGPEPKPPVPPDPVDPDDPDEPDPPEPKPDLTGTAKAVYDAARGADKTTVSKIADAYQKQVTAIQSGSLNGQPIGTAISLVMRGLATDSPPREQAAGIYTVIEKELQTRDDAGKFDTLDGVLACLLEILEGLRKAGG